MSDYILEDSDGNRFLSFVRNHEDDLVNHDPLTHCLCVVKVGNDYLLGWNKWRNRWEIFGGCIDKNESAAECIAREGLEELGILGGSYEYIGLMKFHMMPDWFSPEQRIEYGALYGITHPDTDISSIYDRIQDRDEIVRLALYSEITDKKSIASIDEELLKYY